MATTYYSTIRFKCWKAHTCIRCGTMFRYPFSRKIVGSSVCGPEEARANAPGIVTTALEEGVDTRPCPGCGLIQPDMVGAIRRRRHILATVIAFVVVVVLLILGATNVIGLDTVGQGGAGIALAALLSNIAIATRNPNRSLDANLRRAQRSIQDGTVQVVQASSGTSASAVAKEIRGGRSTTRGVAVLVAAVLGLGMAEAVRTAAGWPLSRDCYPAVVGPGDKTCVYFPSSISAVGDHWSGRDEVAEADVPLRVEGRRDQWGTTIKTEDETSRITPWAWVRIPAEGRLVGKCLPCVLRMTVDYPKSKGSSSFVDVETHVSRPLELHVAPAGAQGAYSLLGWGGGFSGSVLLLMGGILLVRSARALRGEANPTSAMPFEVPAGQS